MTRCYIAQLAAADAWDVCRVEDMPLWHVDSSTGERFYSPVPARVITPISFGHSTSAAMAMLLTLNELRLRLRERDAAPIEMVFPDEAAAKRYFKSLAERIAVLEKLLEEGK